MANKLILPQAERIRDHPFIEAIQDILLSFLPEEIVKRFRIDLEVDVYNKELEPMRYQKENQKFVAEVRYREGEGLEYICELYSWESKDATTVRLLQFITDKYKTKKIGKDWILHTDNTIQLGKYESPDAEVVKPVIKGDQ